MKLGGVWASVVIAGALAGCGTPSGQIDAMAVIAREHLHAAPQALATCFIAAYAAKFPERMSFDRRHLSDGVAIYGLQYGTADDLVLPPRYYWRLDLRLAGGDSLAELRGGQDWAGIDRAGPDVWSVLKNCDHQP